MEVLILRAQDYIVPCVDGIRLVNEPQNVTLTRVQSGDSSPAAECLVPRDGNIGLVARAQVRLRDA